MDDRCRSCTRMMSALLMVLLILGTVSAPSHTVRASVSAQDPDLPPAITDGEWEGVMVSDSTLTGPGVSGGGSFYGEMRLTSSGGALDGSWNLTGTGSVSAEGASGVGVYTANGNVGGSSIDPQFAATDIRIDMTITLPDVGPVETSMSLPPGDSGIVPMFTYGTCGQVVGTWSVSAEGMVGSGTIVLTRVGDLRGEDAPDYLAQVTDLLVDAYAFTESVEAAGTADLAGLEDLLTQADSLYNALRRSTDCGVGEDADVEGYINLLGDVIEHLLEFALSNPDAFSDVSQLRRLVAAAVRTGVTIRSSWDALQDRLSADLEGRLEAAVDSGDEINITMIGAIAVLIGDWDLAEDVSDAAAEEE